MSLTKHACVAGCEPFFQKIIRTQLHDYSYSIVTFLSPPLKVDQIKLIFLESNRLDDMRKAAMHKVLLNNPNATLIFIGPPYRMDEFKLRSHQGKIFQLEKSNVFLQDCQDILDQINLAPPPPEQSLLIAFRQRIFRWYGIDRLQLSSQT